MVGKAKLYNTKVTKARTMQQRPKIVKMMVEYSQKIETMLIKMGILTHAKAPKLETLGGSSPITKATVIQKDAPFFLPKSPTLKKKDK